MFCWKSIIEFYAKMKKFKLAFTQWSSVTFGNIFQLISTIEDVIIVKELYMDISPTNILKQY